MKTLKLVVIGALAAAFMVVPAVAMASKDRDHDGLPDKWEKKFHLSTHTNNAKGDPDRDHLSNRKEFKFGLNPRKADSDGDRTPDNEEQAGVVRSFQNGVLTIDELNGGSVSGNVDNSTEIECGDRNEVQDDDANDDNAGGNDQRDHEDGSGDTGQTNTQAGDNEPGDNENENENEQGDDDQGLNQCSTADLVPGAKVHEAKLSVNSTGHHFDKIELMK
jgi:hypothetical protein